MTHVTCRLTARNRDQLRNPTLANRVWATFTFFKTCLGIIANANPNDTALNCDRISRTAVVVLGRGQINAGAGGGKCLVTGRRGSSVAQVR